MPDRQAPSTPGRLLGTTVIGTGQSLVVVNDEVDVLADPVSLACFVPSLGVDFPSPPGVDFPSPPVASPPLASPPLASPPVVSPSGPSPFEALEVFTAARRSLFAQPEPLKWTAGAVNAFLMGPEPHNGHCVGGPSWIPWMTSKRRPQAAQS
jgi:hypothetical protein